MISGDIGRIWFARMTEGEDLLEGIRRNADESAIRAGVFILIGTVKDAVVGFYENGEYKLIMKNEPLEIVSCVGNIALSEKKEIVVHAHVTFSDVEGVAFGGHLMKGSHVGATAELMIIEAKNLELTRSLDPKTNLNLLKLS